MKLDNIVLNNHFPTRVEEKNCNRRRPKKQGQQNHVMFG
jgi:hypothetical protein